MTDPNENFTLCLPRPSLGGNIHLPVIARSSKPSSIPDNHILIKVERFGFSANNITYQSLGEHPHFRYFDFHPCPNVPGSVSEQTHGVVPVWGFGTVVLSTHPKIRVGEKLYGYLAPARYICVPISLSDVNKFAIYVPRPYLPADRRPYNQLLRCAADPQYTVESEDLTMIFRPLFWTAFWFEDHLWSSNYRNAQYILVSSASAKTAFSLAYLIKQRISRGEIASTIKVIGLTSDKNVPFTKGLDLYDHVFSYNSFASATILNNGQDQKWVYVDVAGSTSINKQVFSHFSTPYTGTIAAFFALGMTNLSPEKGAAVEWKENTFEPSATLNLSQDTSPQEENFFMVEWLNVRKHQLKVEDIFAMQNKAWSKLLIDGQHWVELTRIYGAQEVKQAYEDIAQNGLGPQNGHIWSLFDQDKGKKFARL